MLATKVAYKGSAADVIASVERSLERLRTDAVDIIQFHGGMYTQEEVAHILDDGLLEALERLREQGKARFVGFTVEEPWTARPLVATGRFACVQVRYNLIYQAAALHLLNDARDRRLGVSVMRPMTSGMLQRIAAISRRSGARTRSARSPSASCSPTAACTWPTSGCAFRRRLRETSACSRPSAVDFDMAELPRLTAGIYRAEDEAAGR